MRIDVIMPQMGESVAEGTIIKWTKKVGDQVNVDDTLLEISTDKVDSEIPSSSSGVLAEILADEGNTIEVGKVIAIIETDSSANIEQASSKISEPDLSQQPEEIVEDQSIKEQQPEVSSGKKITPLARSITVKENIKPELLESLSGTGFGGKIVKKDVLSLLSEEPEKTEEFVSPEGQTAKPIVTPLENSSGNIVREKMNHMRKSIADHMVTSIRTSPHVSSIHEVDVTSIMDYISKEQTEFKKREGVKLTLTSFIAQASVKALKEFPIVNASIEGDEIVYNRDINLGIAVALENGLVVPVIRRADEYNLVGLTKAIYDVAIRARNKKLIPDEVQGGTFSITNYGVFDTLIGTPIINQPQVAILGTGAAKQKPVVINQMIGIRWMMYLSLTYDHRLLDGAMGGKFLKYMTDLLEGFNPDSANRK
jgi:2-oxoglutarate dehydrogenase E2 component (dihydrolipoamide succinyltransferase)